MKESMKNKEAQVFLDEVTHPEKLQAVVYILGDCLERLTLTEQKNKAHWNEIDFEYAEDKISANGKVLPEGKHTIGKLTVFVVSKKKMQTHFMSLVKDDFILSPDSTATLQSKGKSEIVIHNQNPETPKAVVRSFGDFVYYNKDKISSSKGTSFEIGDKIFTPDFILERRIKQWKITVFNESVDFQPNLDKFLPEKRQAELPKDYPEYRRSPRVNFELPTDSVKIHKLEKGQEDKKKNGLVRVIVPPLITLGSGLILSLTMGRSLLMVAGTVFATLFMALFTVTQNRTERKDKKSDQKEKEQDYHNFLNETTTDLFFAHQKEKEILDYKNPSPQSLLEKINDYDSRLYERLSNNKDFLEISLGETAQNSSLRVSSDYGIQDKGIEADQVRKIIRTYSQQKEAPLVLDMKGETVGFIGQYDVLKTQVSHLLLQTAFFHSYHDVNFISLVPEESYEEDWQDWRFLPHFKLQELNIRGMVHSERTRDMILNSFLQILVKRKQEVSEGKKDVVFPMHYVFTIFDDTYLSGHGLNEYLAEDLSALGVTVIWCKEDKTLLPETVSAIIELKNASAGEFVMDKMGHRAEEYRPYPAFENRESFIEILRKMSNLNHLEIEKSGLPDSLSLLEQYEVKTVEELDIAGRWVKADPSKSLKSLIGWRGDKDHVYWDLHERVHGPHGFMGGSTGSGKSEFLTTFLLGLAINYSPEDLGMLVIDWKGGGIANTLSGLPHFMGSITNLDGAGTARALASIDAELMKRQREFAKYGVNSINDYMALYKSRHEKKEGVLYPTKPLPHLVLVSDEAKELKKHVPEFIDQLTSVSSIGRSLGLHLILATQKPSSVVNAEIESNSRSRVALMMANVAESKDVIGTGDAAFITKPGRGYLKVGQNEVYELFQSGYAGVKYDPHATQKKIIDERWYEINDLGQEEVIYDPKQEIEQELGKEDLPNQLEAVIKEIKDNFEQSGLSQPDKPWLPNLEDRIPTPSLKTKKARDLSIPLGKLDIPSLQTQENYKFDLEKMSHTVIFSSPGYGKSTALQTIVMNLARQNNPEQIQFNLLDFGTNGLLPLKNLPHVIDMTIGDEVEKTDKMLERIQNELALRKKLFTQVEVASFAQYEAKGETLPIQVIVLDNYDTIAEDGMGRDKFDILISQLLREGAALGVYLLMTANRSNAFRSSMFTNIQSKIMLYMLSEDEGRNLFGRSRLQVPEILGRGQLVHKGQPTAIQIYLPASGEKDADVFSQLEVDIKKLDKDWEGIRPEPIPMVASQISTSEFFETKIVQERLKNFKLPIGFQKESAELFSINLKDEDYFLILGENKERFQTMAIRIFDAYSQLTKPKELLVFDVLGWLKEIPAPKNVTIIKESYKDYIVAGNEVKNHPVFILNAESALNGMTTEERITDLISDADGLILGTDMPWLNKRGDVSKYLKEHAQYGLVVRELTGQPIVPNPYLRSEPDLLDDEGYGFRGREIRGIKLTHIQIASEGEKEF